MSPGEKTRRQFLRMAAASAATAAFADYLRADSAPSPFLRYPNVQCVSATGATVVWTMLTQVVGSLVVTDPSGNSQTIAASVAEFDPSLTGMPETYFQYIASVGNLVAGTQYTYQAQADGQIVPCPLSNPLVFQTSGIGPFNFLHFADSGEGNAAQMQIAQQMAGEPGISLALANGDLAYQLATFASIEANYYGVYCNMMTQIPFFGSLGNHEYYTDSANPTLAARVTPTNGVPLADQGRYYSFDWDNVHFVALDSNAPLDAVAAGTGPMAQWLSNDLANTRKYWKVVFFHAPGYATGIHQAEPTAGEVRQYIVPILEQYGVQLVFNGHEHTYQRTYELIEGVPVAPNSGGIVYVTSGGGGADPYWTAPNDQILESIGMNNYVRGEVSDGTITLRVRGMGQTTDIDSTILAPLPQTFSAVNSASFTGDLASGGAVTIFGRNLAVRARQSSPSAPMMEAASCSASINGTPVPLLYADANQINVQIPFSLVGPATLTVFTPNGVSQTAFNIAAVAPQFFSNPDGSVQALHGDGSMVSTAAPAVAGETVTMLLTGLGSVKGSALAGIPQAAPMPVMASVQMTFGGVPARMGPVMLGANYAGVYEIQVPIPSGLGQGSVAVQVTANGVASNTVSLPIG
jgi:acid phosphatase type 7